MAKNLYGIKQEEQGDSQERSHRFSDHTGLLFFAPPLIYLSGMCALRLIAMKDTFMLYISLMALYSMICGLLGFVSALRISYLKYIEYQSLAIPKSVLVLLGALLGQLLCFYLMFVFTIEIGHY